MSVSDDSRNVNDNSRVLSEWCHNFKRHYRVIHIITIIEVLFDYCNMFIAQVTGADFLNILRG